MLKPINFLLICGYNELSNENHSLIYCQLLTTSIKHSNVGLNYWCLTLGVAIFMGPKDQLLVPNIGTVLVNNKFVPFSKI